ncbi:hypothetical protein HY442_01780 [Candidatus Parcubacteria bacterium]|nr:hypothetical protein [Candidatus Parcubacteria bacterium]
MSEAREAELEPFHETVQMALFQAAIGCPTNPWKQGELAGLLDLICKTKIPAEALPQLIKTCEAVRDTLQGAAWRGPEQIAGHRYLEGIKKIAGEVVENLRLRLEQRGVEGQETLATASGNTE